MTTGTNNLLAQVLAAADDEVQAEILNEFVSQLKAFTHNHEGIYGTAGTQGFYIAKRLRRETAEFFREMLSSYDYLKTEVEVELSQETEQVERLRGERDLLRNEILIMQRGD